MVVPPVVPLKGRTTASGVVIGIQGKSGNQPEDQGFHKWKNRSRGTSDTICYDFSSLHPFTRLISDCSFQTPFALPVSSAMSPSSHHHISLLRHLPTWFPSIVISDSDSLCLPSYLPISDILYDTQTRCGRPFPGLSCI